MRSFQLALSVLVSLSLVPLPLVQGLYAREAVPQQAGAPGPGEIYRPPATLPAPDMPVAGPTDTPAAPDFPSDDQDAPTPTRFGEIAPGPTMPPGPDELPPDEPFPEEPAPEEPAPPEQGPVAPPPPTETAPMPPSPTGGHGGSGGGGGRGGKGGGVGGGGGGGSGSGFMGRMLLRACMSRGMSEAECKALGAQLRNARAQRAQRAQAKYSQKARGGA